MTKVEISLLTLALAACAGAPPPKEHLAASMTAVKTAESAGARNEPAAAKHLMMAKDEIGQAQQMIGKEEHEQADRLTLRATSNAELALALAREAHVKRELSTFASAHPELKASATATHTPSSAPSTSSGAGAPQPSPASSGK